jgi:hypothetical protein
MEGGLESPERKFSTPEEELEYLRAKLAERGVADGTSIESREVIREEVRAYAQKRPDEVLSTDARASEEEVKNIVLELSPEEHDAQIHELLDLLQKRGLRNALAVVDNMQNPHLADDFYRVLVEFLAEGYVVPGVPKKGPMWKALHLVLFEVSLPSSVDADKDKDLKVLLSGMEQLFSGMLGTTKSHALAEDYFALEMGVAHTHEDVVFYVAIPREKKDLFEKQLISIFPRARVTLKQDDYNVFRPEGATAVSYGALGRKEVYPLKTYEQYDHDPLNIILSAFSKMEKIGEGAALQILVSHVGDTYTRKYRKVLEEIEKGESVDTATNLRKSFLTMFASGVEELFESKEAEEKKKRKKAERPVDQIVVEQIKKKVDSPIVATNIRLVASAATQARADSILDTLESTFSQFEAGVGNHLIFNRQRSSGKNQLMKDFSLRSFASDHVVPLNLKELTTLYHLTAAGVSSSRELKQSKAKTAPAPLAMPEEGTMLGSNIFGGKKTDIYITDKDRLRHLYVIGQTGTGKSGLLVNSIIQDMEKGNGVCMIDPHGVDLLHVLANVPRERFKDVVYFDPGHIEHPMGLNMLEYDQRFPEQKTFVVDELLAIFNKLFDMKVSGGPAFEQYFRNGALLVMEHPESGNTLFEIGRVLADKDFREYKLARCKNPVITQFWDNAERTSGDQSLANFVPYVTNKFDIFTTNEIMRPIIGQEKSSFNVRDIMDTKKILLVNLSKGRLGEQNSSLLGLVLVGKILMAALSRSEILEQNPPPFYLYIDEFHNVSTNSISTILSEARKYGLSLTIAHQFIAQLTDDIKNSVFGNVGSLAVFRVGPDDAEYLKTQFEPEFGASDIMQLDNRNAYTKLLIDGRPANPFNIVTADTPKGDRSQVDELKRLSYETYGRPRAEVEKEIRTKYIAS